MWLFVFLFVVFLVCVAMLWNEGMWSNAVTLINVTLACLVALNHFEPLAVLLDYYLPTYTYLWDFLSAWLLFALIYSLLRGVTDFISRYRVRFKMPVEHAGRIIFAACVGWMMVGFTTLTLHTAPLGPHSFGGSFQKTADSGNFLGMAPDRGWLAFVQKSSRGALSRSDDAVRSPYEEDQGRRVFDPQGEFIFKYHARRKAFADQPMFRVRRDESS